MYSPGFDIIASPTFKTDVLDNATFALCNSSKTLDSKSSQTPADFATIFGKMSSVLRRENLIPMLQRHHMG